MFECSNHGLRKNTKNLALAGVRISHRNQYDKIADFIALMDELEADIEAQRQWFEENKDKPLF